MCKVDRVTYHGTLLWVPEGTTTASIAIFLNTIVSLTRVKHIVVGFPSFLLPFLFIGI